MEKVTGKEGKGVTGSGFTGATGSNSTGSLPKSSNAALGIDAGVASGQAEAVDGRDSKGQNVGSGGEEGASGNSKFGFGPDITTGTVRGGIEGVNAKRSPGEFGKSAHGGNSAANVGDFYGSGARKEGTAAASGEPGRGGSMAFAIRGLSGNASGPAASGARQPAVGTQKDLTEAEKGMKGSGGSQ